MDAEENGKVIYMLNDANWEECSKQLKEQYPVLTDQDIHYERGKAAELLCRLEKRLKATRAKVISMLGGNVVVIKKTD